jgi:phthiocerol/phenolphthiocerol synthesis type-I polyketide synthase E
VFATGHATEQSRDLDLTGLAFSALARAISSRWPRGKGCRIGALALAGGAPEAMTVIGYARALQKEWPDATIRAVLVEGDLAQPPDIADTVKELLGGPSETRLSRDVEGRLWRETLVPAPAARNGDRPHGHSLTLTGALLATGGGDGITAEVLVGLARRLRCPVIGRTNLSEDPEDPKVSARRDALRRTQARIEETGSQFMYCQADATDSDAVSSAVEEVRERFGLVGGLIVGAGIMSEGRIEQKPRAVEAEVLASKLDQVNVLREVFRGEELDFVVVFSSLASYTGVVAQADYVAANLGLEAAAADWNRSVSYPVRSILWSVWHETGLAPEWVRRQMGNGGLQGISNLVGAKLLADELDSLDSSPERILFSPESVVRFLLPAEGR